MATLGPMPALDRLDADTQDLATSGADSPSTSRTQDLALGGFQCVNGVRESGRQFLIGRCLLGVRPRIGEVLGHVGRRASSDSSRVGANLLRRRFLMQNRRAMV